jgi:hypothetical protein
VVSLSCLRKIEKMATDWSVFSGMLLLMLLAIACVTVLAVAFSNYYRGKGSCGCSCSPSCSSSSSSSCGCSSSSSSSCGGSSSSSSSTVPAGPVVVNPVDGTDVFTLSPVCPCNDTTASATLVLVRSGDNTVTLTLDVGSSATVSAINLMLVGCAKDMPVGDDGCLDPTQFSVQFQYPCPSTSFVTETFPLPSGICKTLYVAVQVAVNNSTTACLLPPSLLNIRGGSYAPGCASCSGTLSECNANTVTFVKTTLPPPSQGLL